MFILTHRDRVFDPLCCCAIETVLQICFGNFTSSLVQNGQRCTIRILRKTNCFILKTRLNLKHPAELIKDAAGIFLIWEFKSVWLHCQRSPARAFYVKLQIFHQPGWQSRATLEETTTKKKKNTGKPDATQMIWSVPVSAGNVIHISVLLSLCILFKVQQLSIWAIDPAEIVK